MTVESAPGKGSSFHVWLPWREEAVSLQTGPARLAPANRTDRTVLVVESDDAAAALLEGYLRDDGFRVQRVRDARAGLDIARETPPELIVLEINLPGMDGWDFLEAQRQEARLAAIPVVITSIDTQQKSGFSLGSAQILQKPVSAEQLEKILQKLGLVAMKQQRPTVLVVDDEARAVDILRRQLNSGGYEVLSAYGGRDAVLMAQHFHPNLILLDLMMPEFSGFDVVEALQSRQDTAAIPVLVLTAKMVTPEDRRRLNGYILHIMEKAGFQRDRFLGEVRRALFRTESA